MARELLPPEEATPWEEFHDRYLREWSYRNSRGRSARSLLTGVIGMLLIIVAFVFSTYAAGPHGQWWQWPGVALPLVIVAMMLTRAWKLGRRNGERMRELGQHFLARPGRRTPRGTLVHAADLDHRDAVRPAPGHRPGRDARRDAPRGTQLTTGIAQALVIYPAPGALGIVSGICLSPDDLDPLAVLVAGVAARMTVTCAAAGQEGPSPAGGHIL